ncbi:hypothetical protein [Saccharospirillum salsuginis]|uniref:Glyoxalase-like domain-containing protein n=1 Tax=Saccharospirillum salsuginis TaxID=418750 RepID=A0A918KIZ9_9GAMM|nr:hypothetical protein [Saccharospirillum salsuginis]GGX62657.1 hypothetical protein GCM10007392_33200 [Saccharospirillum salsuginis]
MLKLDHVVLHSDGTAHVEDLKETLQSAGIPYEPSWGKKARGFRISNIWIGRQYFEIVEIHSDDNLWQPQWADRHREGERGTFCLFLKVDRNIDDVYRQLVDSGVEATAPERTRFKWLFGLLEKKLPWRFITLPKIPGTDIELGIIEYDEGAERKFEPFMVPNGTEVGLTGLSNPVIQSFHSDLAEQWLAQIQTAIGEPLPIAVVARTSDEALHLTVESSAGATFTGAAFSDVTLSP